MKKAISVSIRGSEDELEMLKRAAKLLSYSSIVNLFAGQPKLKRQKS